MKILITGAAGFIGTNFTLYAKKKGFQIIGLDNFSIKSSLKRAEFLKKNGINIVEADIRRKLAKDYANVDIIIHLAANCSTSRSIKNPFQDFKNNAFSTINLLEFSKKNGNISIIYASTIKVYSDNINYLPLTESKIRYNFKNIEGINEKYPIEQGSHAPYGCSKYTGDIYCQEYHYTYNVPMIINRMSSIYGTYQYDAEEAGWIYHFIYCKKNNLPITIFGNGKQVRDALYVSDLCKLFDLQIKNFNKINGQIYNIGGGLKNSISLIELINYLNKKPGNKLKTIFSNRRASDLKVFICDLAKIKNDLNWKPKVNIFNGIDLLYNKKL